MSDAPSAAYSVGDYVRVVGAADFDLWEGEVAWVDPEVRKLGVRFDDEPLTMPVTFLYSEVQRA